MSRAVVTANRTVPQLVEHRFRHAFGRIVAALVRVIGTDPSNRVVAVAKVLGARAGPAALRAADLDAPLHGHALVPATEGTLRARLAACECAEDVWPW